MRFMHRFRRPLSLLVLTGLMLSMTAAPAGAEYDPKTGRWLQRDPNGMGVVLQPGLPYHAANPTVTVSMAYELQYADGMNFYQFVQSNPVNRTDPNGLFSLPDLLSSAAIRVEIGLISFGAVHPAAMRFIGGLLAATNLYGFIQYEEVQAVVVAQPDPLGFLAAEAAALRLAVRDVLAASGSVRGLVRAGAQSSALASQAGRFVQAEAAAQTVPRIQLSQSRVGEAAQHIRDAQAAGQPRVLTIDRAGASARRRAATSGHPRSSEVDLDEYPPAVFREGGAGASVRAINITDNRTAGAILRNQLQGLPDGTEVILEVVP